MNGAIRGFMTVCCIGHFAAVFSEILDCLRESGLYEKSLSIDLAVLGTPSDRAAVARTIAPFGRFRIAYESDDIGDFEYPALMLLGDACAGFDGLVYYLHTKGVSHGRTNQYQRHWRALMLHHVVERHEECLSALESHDAAGTVWKGDHYSGNFWWARAEHVRCLPDLRALRLNPRRLAWDPAADVRIQCEYWIAMAPGKYKSIGPECVHLYDCIRWTHSADEIVAWLLEASGGSRCLELAGASGGLGRVDVPVRHVVAHQRASTFDMSEQDFFSSRLGEAAYDLVFIDSPREAEACREAIERSLGRVLPRGTIVVRGTNPPTAWHQRPVSEYEPGSEWTGDAWKAVVRFRREHPEMGVTTVDTDWGCTVIRPSVRARVHLQAIDERELTWPRFDQNRADWLNLALPRHFRRELGCDDRRRTA